MQLHTRRCEFEMRPEIKLRQLYSKGLSGYPPKLRAQRARSEWSTSRKVFYRPTARVIAYPSCPPKHREISGLLRAIVKGRRIRTIKSGVSFQAQEILRAISNAAVNPDLRDEDEAAPSPDVIGRATRLILEADKLLGGIPSGQVATFYGELNVTWRAGNEIVRLACFPHRPSLLQVGSLELPVGSYRSDEDPSSRLLAARISDLIDR